MGGSASARGRTRPPAERCTGRCRGKKRNSRARGQAGSGSRSRGHTSGEGEVVGRGLGGRHGRPSPGCRAVAGGPRLQVHVAGPAQDGRGNGRSDAQASGAVQGEFVPDNGKAFAARREVAAGRTSFFFAQPYRERGLNEHMNGLVRQYKATGKLDPAEPRGEPARQPTAQGAGLPDSRGSFQAGVDRGPAPLKRNPARLAGARSGNGPVCMQATGLRQARASRRAAPIRVSGSQDRTNGVSPPPRRDQASAGEDFHCGRGVRPGYPLPAVNAPAAPAS